MTTKCNLIIDSCCDLPYEVVSVEGVSLIQFPYLEDGKDHLDDFYQSITPHEFFEGMRQGATPSTSQLSQQILTDVFTQAAQSGVPTVYLSFSSALSGSFDAACLVRDRVAEQYPDATLFVVDTRLASVAEGMLTYEAMRQREKGLSAEEMVAWAEEARYFVNCMFMVDDLESLRRGGRIPASVAMAGAKLDVKPLLTIDLEGSLTLCGVARGRKKGLKQMVDFYEKHVDETADSNNIVIANADCPKDADRVKDLILKNNSNALFLESSIGPVIGSHVGPGMVALVFWGPDRREGMSVADRIAKRVKGDK